MVLFLMSVLYCKRAEGVIPLPLPLPWRIIFFYLCPFGHLYVFKTPLSVDLHGYSFFFLTANTYFYLPGLE